jgi:hypothetical protein
MHKILLKIPLSEAISGTTGIGFSSMKKLNYIKLKGIDKYLNLMTRNQMLDQTYMFNLNLNIFKTELRK